MDLEVRKLLDQLFDRLDRLDYYEILGVARGSDGETIRQAFYARAELMHPDRHYNIKDSDLREKLYLVYKRVAEAYRVLGSEARRSYDARLNKGVVRQTPVPVTRDAPRDPELTIKNLRARQLYLDSRAAKNEGNVKGALLALQMAAGLEPRNPAIQRALADTMTEIQGRGGRR